jgi:hypothetical protein
MASIEHGSEASGSDSDLSRAGEQRQGCRSRIQTVFPQTVHCEEGRQPAGAPLPVREWLL